VIAAKVCDNNTQNNSKEHGALAKMDNMQAELETFNQQGCSPGSCHSLLDLQKLCDLLKPC